MHTVAHSCMQSCQSLWGILGSSKSLSGVKADEAGSGKVHEKQIIQPSIYLNVGVAEGELLLSSREAGFNSISWPIYITFIYHILISCHYTGGDIYLLLSAICLLCLYILLRGFMWTVHRKTDKDNFYSNSSASFALRSLLSNCSPVIRREHTLAINNDLNVSNKRLHTTSTPWLPNHHPYPSRLS